MEKNPKDQNLADASDNEHDTFNPKNNYSEPEKDGPVGPLGSPPQSVEEKVHQDGTIGTQVEKDKDNCSENDN